MLQKFVNIFGGDPNKKEINKISEIVEQVNAFEPQFEELSNDALRAKTDEFRALLKSELEGVENEDERKKIEQAVLDELLPEAYAVVREVSKRTLGMRPFDVQMIGGIVLHRGQIAEMRTGEGKTLVATLPIYLNALTGRGVHLVTVNDYLARRDARWMAPIYHFLGLSVGVLQMAAATENGKKAFIYDPEKESTQEDQHQLRLVDRRRAYEADITYGTNAEFGFDYLRDNMTMRLEDRVQRGHYYCIIDEVDNVLIDEARTPLIISGPASGDLEWYGRMAQIVKQLKPEDYELSEKDRSISLTEIGVAHVEQLLGQPLMDPDRPEDLNPEQARLMGYLEQALRAQYLFHRNKDYLVQAGKVVIVDTFTGRLMPGRRWSDGLHQAVEAKEGVRVEPENITYATITLQNYYRMYEKLSGMTGTALTEAEEFSKIYKLEVLPIPTNLEHNATRPGSPLVERKDKDEDGYEYSFFMPRDATSDNGPVLWRRKDYPDVIFRSQEAKLRNIVREVVFNHALGRPLLIGTTSVESSERLSERLRAEPVRRLMQVLLIRDAWMGANGREEDGRLIPELVPLNAPLERIQAPDLRQFARPLELSLNPEDQANLSRLIELLGLSAENHDRLKSVLQGGVPHQVLNARKHTEESQIIAGAGAFGAVTIATNMAGRGVDIKLGGEMAEEIIAIVNRVLKRTEAEDPYEMSMEERRQALLKLDPSEYGIYEAEIKHFLQYFEDMAQVKALGGLHVIGSERHEARRIDNQLRGRAARQGDPGSSRFYLSLEDDLMRLFGGQQVSGLMDRLKVDESLPLEAKLVSNIVEGSQHRVEGANFDVRKHLLEYDDVLNSQRERIYSQRDRVFTKDDLTDDVAGMLQAEVETRVPAALADEEGPWKLLAWLEQTQPTFNTADGLFPSYTYRLLLDEIEDGSREQILSLVRRAVETENGHIWRAVAATIDRTAESLDSQMDERREALETFLEALGDRDETDTRRPQELLEELQSLARVPLRLNNEQLRQLADDPEGLADDIEEQVEQALTAIAVSRLLSTLEYRLGESLSLDKNILARLEWDELVGKITGAARRALEGRLEMLVSQAGRDLDILLQRGRPQSDDERIRLLGSLSQGSRTAFDAKTHRQVRQSFARFNYLFLAAKLLENRSDGAVAEDVLEHLEIAQETLGRAWGTSEYARLSRNAASLADFGPAAAIFTESRREASPASLSDEERETLMESLSRAVQTQIYRQVLLNAITELWVEYLTKVEALRVAIGLEAYAQRDPLVQYKTQASEMFQNLLGDIRSAVVSRIFLYQPRAYAAARIVESEETVLSQPQPVTAAAQDGGKKKKKRKRH